MRFVPRMSAGIRSGVNWIRENCTSSTSLSTLASSVLPSPGMLSISRLPPAKKHTSRSSIASSQPTMARSSRPGLCETLPESRVLHDGLRVRGMGGLGIVGWVEPSEPSEPHHSVYCGGLACSLPRVHLCFHLHAIEIQTPFVDVRHRQRAALVRLGDDQVAFGGLVVAEGDFLVGLLVLSSWPGSRVQRMA